MTPTAFWVLMLLFVFAIALWAAWTADERGERLRRVRTECVCPAEAVTP